MCLSVCLLFFQMIVNQLADWLVETGRLFPLVRELRPCLTPLNKTELIKQTSKNRYVFRSLFYGFEFLGGVFNS